MYDHPSSLGHQSIIDILNRYSEVQSHNFMVRNGEAMPSLDFDLYICTAGQFEIAMSHDWQAPLFDLLERIEANNEQSEDKKYVCLIGESYQMYRVHKRWSVQEGDKRFNYSIGTLQLKAEALAMPDYKKAPKKLPFADFGRYQLRDLDTLPDDHVSLAVADINGVEQAMMVQMGSYFCGFDFQPEVTVKGLRQHYHSADVQKKLKENFDTKMVRKIEKTIEGPLKIETTRDILFTGWVNSCIQKINLQRKLKAIMGQGL